MYSETRKLDQFNKYHAAESSKDMLKHVRMDGVYGYWGIELGRMLALGHLTKEEHDKRFHEVRAYDRNEGPLPEWVNNAEAVRGNDSIRPQKP
jgi:hypothetical protein